ncbi:MAG: molybdopterin-binding protein, partial [Anaerolineaceae bacterium]
LALFLRENGISLYRVTLVGDNLDRIAAAIREALARVDLVITSGGLGPTVDDPTREAVAKAVEVSTVFIPELWEQIQNRFQRFNRKATDNNRKQAYIPEGAIPVENRVGTAPAFIMETGENGQKAVISLPGVPKELQYLLENKIKPYLRQKFPDLETIKALVLHASGVGESQVDEWISDLETRTNPTVGLLAKNGQVDIRITARARSEREADAMIAELADEIYRRMGRFIYGKDGDTQDQIIQELLSRAQWKALARPVWMGKAFTDRLTAIGISVLEDSQMERLFENLFEDESGAEGVQAPGRFDVLFETKLTPGPEQQHLRLRIKTPNLRDQEERSYGGPAQSKEEWAANSALDFLRRHL